MSSPYPYPLLIRHLLHTPLAQSPDREIVYADRLSYDYRELVRRIGRLGSALSGLGVEPGDTVAVLDWDSHRYLECFFAIPMLGAVLHTVNVRLSPEQILYTINHAKDDVLLVHADFMPLVGQIAGRIERPVRIVALGDGAADGEGAANAAELPIVGEYEALLAAADPGFPFADFDEQTRATTFYTTGTTGLPKGVFFSHRQIVLHTLGFMLALNWTARHARFHRDDVYMPITPMFHVHAWGVPYGATLTGIKQVYPGRYEPGVLFDLIERHGVTFSHCVPTILHMLLSHPRAESVDLSNWKVVIGGAALPQGLAKRAMALGIDIFSGYGMSETGPYLCLSTLDGGKPDAAVDEQVAMRCKTGRPGPLVDLKVVDAEGKEVAPDGKTPGEIVVRAPWLTQGYVENPEATRELWRGGYLHTGDIAVVDEEGYLQITDRLKDVIKSGGEWISSLELESIVSQVDGVAEVAAIGVPDEKWSERPLVIVVPASDALTEDAVKAGIKEHAKRGAISPWAVPERVLIVDAIDKTSVGKIDKKLLREKYGGTT